MQLFGTQTKRIAWQGGYADKVYVGPYLVWESQLRIAKLEVGAFALSGSAATIRKTRVVLASGSFAMTGESLRAQPLAFMLSTGSFVMGGESLYAHRVPDWDNIAFTDIANIFTQYQTFQAGGTLGDSAGDTVVIKGTTVNSFSSGLLAGGTSAAWRTSLGLGTAAVENIGTSGANVPLLSTANTWSFPQTIDSATGASVILDKGGSGNASQIVSRTAGVERWHARFGDGALESGADAGSNLAFLRYSDAGGFLGTPFSINRATGLVTMPTGADITAAILKGITDLRGGNLQFPATAIPSTDPNTLDDYEEGTWTPEISFVSPGTLSVSYATQDGTYTKIGNIVTVRCAINFTPTLGTASGSFKVTGLPFTGISPSLGNAGSGAISNTNSSFTWPAGTTQITIQVNPGATEAGIAARGSGIGGAGFTPANLTNGGAHLLVFALSYFAAS